jgi:hypothetical protein
MDCCSYDRRTGLSNCLQPCRDIRCIAEYVGFLAPAPTTTAPESMPTRAASSGVVESLLSFATASRIAGAARTASSPSLS